MLKSYSALRYGSKRKIKTKDTSEEYFAGGNSSQLEVKLQGGGGGHDEE